jgi:hypothetical protein
LLQTLLPNKGLIPELPAALPRPARPAPIWIPASGAVDHAYDLTGASWSCPVYGGITLVQRFERSNDGSALDATTTATFAHGPQRTLHDTYVFDAGTGRWVANLDGGKLRAGAWPWFGPSWEFTGSEFSGRRQIDVRITYTRLGPDTFRRELARSVGGAWRPYAEETCRRMGA